MTPKGATTYGDSTKEYFKLREDWWETNRDKVWNAMKCAAKFSGKIHCGGDDTPPECYVPQRLRWSTEWARQVCKEKEQKKKYVVNHCKDSSGKVQLSSTKIHTSECKNASKYYEQWNNNIKDLLDQLNKKCKNYKNKQKDNPLEDSIEDYIKSKCTECKCSIIDIEKTFEISKNGGNIHETIVRKASIDENILIKIENATWLDLFIHAIVPPIFLGYTGYKAGKKIAKEVEPSVAKDVLEKLKNIIRTLTYGSSDSPSFPTPSPCTDNDKQGRSELSGGDGQASQDALPRPPEPSAPAEENGAHAPQEHGAPGKDGISAPAGPEPPSLPKGDDSSLTHLFNLLTYGTSLRIGFLLGSAAFLFFYQKVTNIYM